MPKRTRKLKSTLLTLTAAASVLLSAYICYQVGRRDGCYDVIDRENELGVNTTPEGKFIGLSAYAWCHKDWYEHK